MQRTLNWSPSASGQLGPPASPALPRVRRTGRRHRPLRGHPPAALIALGLALGSVAPARAVNFTINTDTTLDSTYSIDTNVSLIGSAILTIRPGGFVGGHLVTSNSSTVIMSGGSIKNGLTLLDSSAANISGGSLVNPTGPGMQVDSGTASISGTASVSGDTAVYVNGGTANISGGSLSNPTGSGVQVDSGTANISGGSIAGNSNGAFVRGGTANITGGTLTGGIIGVYVNGGTADLSGGTATGGIQGVLVNKGSAAISGNATLSGGIGVDVIEGTAAITGGTLSGTYAGVSIQGGTSTLSGGSVSGGTLGLFIHSGTLTVDGCPLIFAGGSLTGNLADGTPINFLAQLTDPGKLVLNNVSTGAPLLTCPANLQVIADPGGCSARVAPTASASDTCDPNPLVAGARSDGLALTAPYPGGTTSVTWTATNNSGYQSTCTQTVTVRDAEKPTIAPPADVIVDADPGQSSARRANVRLGTPQTADNCGVATVGSDAPASFPAGMTTVTWTALDRSGNSAAATQQVTVKMPTQRFADAVQAGQDQVAALSSAGLLTPALRIALTALLQGIQRALSGRTISAAQLAAARQDVNGTIARIQAQLSAGKLPPAQVQLLQGLLSVAQAVARALGP